MQESGGAADQLQALLAEAQSPFDVRILRLDMDLSRSLLVCGDRTGNILAFHLKPKSLHFPGEYSLPT